MAESVAESVAESQVTKPFSQVASWVKQWVGNWFLRKIGSNTYTGTLTVDDTLAAGAAGLRLEDDGGNLGVFVEDGGKVYFTNAPGVRTVPANGYIHQETAVTAGVNLALWHNAADANGPTLILGKSRGTVVGSNTVVADNDNLGIIYWYGGDFNDTVPTSSPGAAIWAEVDGTPANNDIPAALVFATKKDGVAGVNERMRIDDAGNVGIGTGTPESLLHVSGGAIQVNGTYGRVTIYGTLDAGLSMIDSGAAANAKWALFSSKDGYAKLTSITDAGALNVDNILTASLANGKVGIGQTTHATYHVAVGVNDAGSGFYCSGGAYFTANVSAESFTDRTKGYAGDALADLAGVKDKDGKLDHDSLPEFARKDVDGVPGRDLGAMISILTVAVQQLTARVEQLEARR